MENEYSSLITNLGGQVYQKAKPFRETGEDRKVNVVSNIPKNYTPTTYELSGNILVFTLSPELKNLYPNSTARLGDKTVSIQTLESPLEVKVGETVDVNINWGDRYIEAFTIYNPNKGVEPGPEPDPKLKIPFYIENIGSETNTFGIFIDVHQDEPVQFTFEISEDGNAWEEYTISSDSEDFPQFSMEFTEKLYVRAKTNTYFVDNEEEDSRYGIKMGCMNNFNVGGNSMSLLYGSDFTGKETVFPQGSTYTFSRLFYEVPALVSAKDLILPATTLAYSCYNEMFSNCTSLTIAPQLPATTLAEECYSWMFYGCTSLIVAPELPATTLAEECYNGMFAGCISLISAPELPATTLSKACYHTMFAGCTSLTSAPQLPATELVKSCYYSMFKDCTSLTITPNLLAQRLADHCYMYMFDSCTSLTTAHELPATELANSCYEGMFANCTSLTSAPSTLPATVLIDSCYSIMFYGCTSLTSAPELKGTELVNRCYNLMFYGCTSLNSVIIYIEGSWVGYRSSLKWLYNVAPSGTLYSLGGATFSPASMSDPSGCPTGWTIKTELPQE